jgi:glycine cleavage system transcriptional repressor
VDSRENLIMTAVGPDRIGLVERLSEFIVQRGCNIEDSKMAVFCGEFAQILLISGPMSGVQKVTEEHAELSDQTGLSISVKKPSRPRPTDPQLPYRLTASCLDHPGVVHRISSVLSNLAINIESMETKTYFAPWSGTPIFRMEALLSVPAELNVKAIRTRFDEIEREENIDIDLALLGNRSGTT